MLGGDYSTKDYWRLVQFNRSNHRYSMNFKEWVNGDRLVRDFLLTFENKQVQVHILQALMSHDHYRGKRAMDILDMEIPAYLEKDVQEHLGL